MLLGVVLSHIMYLPVRFIIFFRLLRAQYRTRSQSKERKSRTHRGNLTKQIIMKLCVVSNGEEIFVFFWLNRNRPSVECMTMGIGEKKIEKGMCVMHAVDW